MKNEIDLLKEFIKTSNKIVFFGGAGVSTESNIPDFRSKNGLFKKEFKGLSPEKILHIDFLKDDPKTFYEFYKDFIINEEYKPNRVHKALKELEKFGLNEVITQNIDGLHSISSNVLEIHGNAMKFHCVECGKEFDKNYILNNKHIYPICDKCEVLIRPNIVLYGEILDDNLLNKAANAISECDLLIVGGTSLLVEPASSLLNFCRSGRLVIINNQETPYDQIADLVINKNIGDVFEEILKN